MSLWVSGPCGVGGEGGDKKGGFGTLSPIISK